MDKATAMAKALSNPLKVKILLVLRARPLCVCKLERLLNVPQPTLSNALRDLRLLGLVKDTPKGRWRIYSLGEVPGWVYAFLDWVGVPEELREIPPFRCGWYNGTDDEEV